MIRLEGVSFRYRAAAHPALTDLSFEIQPGQSVGLLGRSGSGRSTLAATLNGTIPSLVRGELSGRVVVAEYEVGSRRPRDLAGRVGILFQDFEAQLFSTNVALEVAFGPENLGLNRTEIVRRVREYLALVGLSHLEHKSPAALSGGQKQRLALASVLALEPDVLVLDEPTSDLDPTGRRDLLAAIATLRARREVTLVFIDPETDEIGWTDRLLVLDAGRLVQDGSPTDLCSNSERLAGAGVKPCTLSLLLQTLGVRGPATDPYSAAQAIQSAGWRAATDAIDRLSAAREPSVGNTVIEARDLGFRYPEGTTALADVSCAIRQGEFVAVLGQNGSGKTTFMKLCNGILTPTAGEVRIGGEPVGAHTPAALSRRVGLVFQNPDHQIFAENIWDEVAFGPRMHGWTETEVAARVTESLEAVGLSGMGHLDPFVLSKGGRQRVAVAATLATKPEVIILDEPTTGLDYEELHGMMALLERLNASGHTIVIVTHAIDVAAAHARRTIVMQDGRIATDLPTRTLFSDAGLLDRLRLTPPPLIQAAHHLGVPALRLEELCGALERTD
ncbi:MAG TPA: energy-coupling factor transporter ATPase [Candidatus Baltobacteraceae bacterium]|nr:energy-coupling factor transporter ATPase [Candidatus Baltobacteraceae bacterium]